MSKTPFEECCSTLGRLTKAELIELRSIIDDLLSVPAEDVAEADLDGAGKRKGRKKKVASGGYLELKTIRGYGPYLYLRRWKGKRLTSTYLGKGRS
jgi:hypothetical protein